MPLRPERSTLFCVLLGQEGYTLQTIDYTGRAIANNTLEEAKGQEHKTASAANENSVRLPDSSQHTYN